MNNISYKKLNLVALGTIIISIIMYCGFILMDLFTGGVSNNQYYILIVMVIIFLLSILGLICGVISFLKARKIEINSMFIPKTDIILITSSTIINFCIAIYSFMNLCLIFYFIRA